MLHIKLIGLKIIDNINKLLYPLTSGVRGFKSQGRYC